MSEAANYWDYVETYAQPVADDDEPFLKPHDNRHCGGFRGRNGRC